MRKTILSVFAYCFCILFSGCVSLRVIQVDPDNPQRAKGFRYYMPEPYLLVHEIPRMREVKTPVVLEGKLVKGAYENSVIHEGRMEIIYLPDRDREMAVSPKAVLSKQKLSFKLEEGWKLTEVSGEQESDLSAEAWAEVLAELVKGSAEVAKVGIQAMAQDAEKAGDEETTTPIPPGLYRLRMQEGGLLELERVMMTWKTGKDGQETRTYMDLRK